MRPPAKCAQTAAVDSFPSPGRRLSTTLCIFNSSQVADFTAAVNDRYGSCDVIELVPGVYKLTQELVVDSARTLTIQAQTSAPPGSAASTVVLDAQNNHRVFRISGGTVSLIGLGIANGNADSARCPCPAVLCALY